MIGLSWMNHYDTKLMMPIKMIHLYRQYLAIQPEIDRAIADVVHSTTFINGKIVQDFARELANYLQVKFVLPCANGTDALQIALMTLSLQPDDEVIIPSHTYVSTAEVVALLGLKPVFIDVDKSTFTMDVSQIEYRITSKTKVIIPVHLYGQCADMESVLNIAKKYGLYVIEDNAQALGADYIFSANKIKKAGTMGTIGTTSFYPSKNLGAYGDGGAIFTNDESLFQKCKMIADHGQNNCYQHHMIGCNSRLDSIQAAILSVKLKHLNEYNIKKRKLADIYDMAFEKTNYLTTPYRVNYSTHVFHQYTLKTHDIDRDTLKEYLKSKKIFTMIYYPIPLHEQKAYSKYANENLLITEQLKTQLISLPIFPELHPEEQEYIIEQIYSFLG